MHNKVASKKLSVSCLRPSTHTRRHIMLWMACLACLLRLQSRPRLECAAYTELRPAPDAAPLACLVQIIVLRLFRTARSLVWRVAQAMDAQRVDGDAPMIVDGPQLSHPIGQPRLTTPLMSWIAEASASGDLPTVTLLPPSPTGAVRPTIVSWASPSARAPSPFAQAAATPFDQLVASSSKPAAEVLAAKAPTSTAHVARTAARSPESSPPISPRTVAPGGAEAADGLAPLLTSRLSGSSSEGSTLKAAGGRRAKAFTRGARGRGGQVRHDSASSWRMQLGALDTPPPSGTATPTADGSDRNSLSPDELARGSSAAAATVSPGGAVQPDLRREWRDAASLSFDMPPPSHPPNLRCISAPGSLYGSCSLPLAEFARRLDSSPPSLSGPSVQQPLRASTADEVLLTDALHACRSASLLHGAGTAPLRSHPVTDEAAAQRAGPDEPAVDAGPASSAPGQAGAPSTDSAVLLPYRCASSNAVVRREAAAELPAAQSGPPNPFMRAASAPSPGTFGWDDGGADTGDDGSGGDELRSQSGGAAVAAAAWSGAGGDDWAWSPVVAPAAGEPDPASSGKSPLAMSASASTSLLALSSPQGSGIFNTDRDILLPYKLIMEAMHTGADLSGTPLS